MKDLTQEESERCAKAYGWTEDILTNGSIVWSPDGRVKDNSMFPSEIPYDFHFWLPKLWDKLESFVGKSIDDVHLGAIRMMYPNCSGEYVVTIEGSAKMVDWDGYAAHGISDHPCLAFCEAIEALEEK